MPSRGGDNLTRPPEKTNETKRRLGVSRYLVRSCRCQVTELRDGYDEASPAAVSRFRAYAHRRVRTKPEVGRLLMLGLTVGGLSCSVEGMTRVISRQKIIFKGGERERAFVRYHHADVPTLVADRGVVADTDRPVAQPYARMGRPRCAIASVVPPCSGSHYKESVLQQPAHPPTLECVSRSTTVIAVGPLPLHGHDRLIRFEYFTYLDGRGQHDASGARSALAHVLQQGETHWS
ncbi:hypothetical protein EVAR_64606_1 [Eumeta japonica]|uniref:Uncharacterized protein n=1 Tax=Eumeta variegata TaxID=151549 RepID=A0A4C1Z7L6_EUMVA|nr:hypothetical protein EVAR_64606_1 [Eumeta japonica]